MAAFVLLFVIVFACCWVQERQEGASESRKRQRHGQQTLTLWRK
jgi:hypothetical protein